MPEKLSLSKEEAQAIVWEDTDDYTVVKDRIVDTSRWSEIHEIVIRRKSDDKLFIDNYQEGLTESQDELPYEYTDPDFVEAEAYEKTVVKYRVKK